MDINNVKRILQEAELKLMQKRNEDITKELKEAISRASVSKDELLKAVSDIKINVPKADVPKAEVDVNIPEIKIPKVELPNIEVKVPEIKLPTINIPKIELPDIKIPEIKVPKIPKPEITVNVPKISIPDLKWPKERMPIEGWVQLMGIDLNNPLPVQLRDSDGRPVRMPEVIGGGGSSGPGRKVVQIEKPKSVKMFNIAIAVADTEYSQEIPLGTKAMTMQNREDNDMRVSYEIGKVAGSTTAFMTLKAGQAYYETNVELSGKTIYVASGRAGTAEIVAYY